MPLKLPPIPPVVLGDLGEALGEDYPFVAGAPVHHTQYTKIPDTKRP